MNDERTRWGRATSLPLLALTLLAGVALGWLLRDLAAGAQRPAASAPTPAASALPVATSRPTEAGAAPTALPTALAPTLAPTFAPTAAPSVLPTLAPTLPPSPTPAPSATPAPTAAPEMVGYAGHRVAEGETLESIAAAGGSSAELIARYNLLGGAARPGLPLIVPRLAGQASTLESQPLLVRQGEAGKPWVALTLDAGASAEPVPDILATLRARHVTITFFLTGKWISENPELTRQIVEDGHEIANHTFNHPDMRTLSAEAFAKELSDTEAALSEAVPGASARPFFRPPYGAYDERVLLRAEALGYLPIYWTLDSLDSVGEPKTPEFLLERVTAKLSPEQLRGAIILAHCGSRPTADALPAILDRFAVMGIEVKKLSEVL